ncbi:lipopolysaccharide heptosyltransferase II [bacterium]|nr:lipopolysaccharide heptosyltransferase II [bacterium]
MSRGSVKPHKKILVIRFSAMGDVILTTPFLRILKKEIPDAQVDFIVKLKFSPLLEGNQNISSIITVPERFLDFVKLIFGLRKNRYDVVFDLQRNFKSSLIMILSGAKKKRKYKTRRFRRFVLVKFKKDIYRNNKSIPLRFLDALDEGSLKDDGKGAELNISEESKKRVSSLLEEAGIIYPFNMIVLAPGAGRATKRWNIKGFAEVGKHFIRLGYDVAIIGGEEDKDICKAVCSLTGEKAINFCGKTNLSETAAFMSICRLLISNDTGVMHMAGALNTPVVAIFGPTTKELGFFPFRGISQVVQIPLKCRPCSFHGTAKCSEQHFRCMNDITADMVIEAAENLITGA